MTAEQYQGLLDALSGVQQSVHGDLMSVVGWLGGLFLGLCVVAFLVAVSVGRRLLG